MKFRSYLDPHPRHRDAWSLGRTSAFLDAASHGLPAFWAESKFLALHAEIDRETASAWLPPGLRPSDPARALIFAVDYVRTALGFDYREVGVLLHARLRGKPVLHVAWMVVDDDTALILGRELLGFPKKLAEIHFEIGSESAEVLVRRRGTDLLELRAELAEPISATPIFPHPIVNVRGLPGPLPNLLFRMDGGERFNSGRAARFDLKVQESPFDPLMDLGLASVQQGVHATVDIAPRSERVSRWPRVWPVAGLIRPSWLLRAYPFRTW
ncbi:MAG: acetoacetate decarboxylase family protein [Planctomycetota bacterium]